MPLARFAEWLLYAVAVTAVIDAPSLPLPVHVTIADVLALLAAVAFAVSLVRGEVKLVTRGALWAAIAYLAWAGVSAAAHRSGGWKIVGIAELVCLLAISASIADRDRLLRAWTWGAALACVIGLGTAVLWSADVELGPLYTGAGELGARWRPAGVCRSGMLAQYALVPLVWLILDGKSLGRARMPLIALISITVALTLTRTILAVPFALLYARRPRHPVLLLLIALALLSIYIDVHGSLGPGIRWRIAASALHHALAHPLFGLGPAAHAATAGWPTGADAALPWDAHCTPLDLAATLGIPALLAFSGVVALSFGRARGVMRVALAAMIFDALTVDLADFRHLWLLVGLAWSARAATARPTDRDTAEPPPGAC